MSRRARPIHQHLAVGFVLGCSGASPPGAVTMEPATGSTGETETDATGDLPTGAPTTSEGSTATTSVADTSTSSTDTTTTATGPGGVCGDAKVDPGEDCDLGMENRDDGPCTVLCESAVCGDGKVWSGVEACDLGGDNGPNYAGCSALCQKNAHCGDSSVDVPFEQCDAGPGNGSGESEDNTVPCTVGCRWDGRITFLSRELYDGDFGGLDGADQKCRTLGKAAGVVRWETLMAWLSNGEVGPLDRFVLIPAKPYMLPTGERIADSLSDLVLDGPGDGIRVDEHGKPLPPSYVWTNTSVVGAPYSPLEHCSGWDSTVQGGARVGFSHVPHEPEEVWQAWHEDKQWTSFTGWECSELARLYCFEQ
jgi:hypothetical protein